MIKYLSNIYKENQIPNFKNILTYYQFLGSQVTFSNTRLIFAIHVPIIRTEVFIFYRLYPIIHNRQIFIPKYPYLAQTNSKTQFENEECPLLEETYYCTEHFHPDDDCTLQLIKNDPISNCQTLQINVQEPITEQVTQNEVLIVPVQEEKLFSKCKTDQYVEIRNPILVKIPESCEIQINQKTFINDIRIQKGKPLILPKINIQKLEPIKSYETPNFTKLNLEQMYQINDMVQQLTPLKEIDDSSRNTTLFSVIFTIILITLIIILFKKRKQLKTSLQNCLKKPETKDTPAELGPRTEPSKNNSLIFSV